MFRRPFHQRSRSRLLPAAPTGRPSHHLSSPRVIAQRFTRDDRCIAGSGRTHTQVAQVTGPPGKKKRFPPVTPTATVAVEWRPFTD